jgi:hypothetical protein
VATGDQTAGSSGAKDEPGVSSRPPLPLGALVRWRERRQRLEGLYLVTVAELQRAQERADAAGRDRRGEPETDPPATTADVADGVGVPTAAAATAAEQHPCDERGVRLRSAKELLQSTEEAMRCRRLETAWALLLESRRALLYCLDADELSARAASLRAEVDEKLTGWRQSAALAQLGSERPTATQLEAATYQLDASYGATHRRLRTRTIELTWLTIWLAAGIGLGLLVLRTQWPVSPTDGVRLDLAAVAWLSPIVGAVGATLSAMQRTVGRPATRVPDERAATIGSVTRPLAGAATGGVVLLFFQAGLLTEPGVLPAAFASGFSERFILRFLPDGAPAESEQEPRDVSDATGDASATSSGSRERARAADPAGHQG